ncbi:hypothetical protein AKJ63_00340, partial [candidate division MSBL1 archaeon SCGC-AAA259D18]
MERFRKNDLTPREKIPKKIISCFIELESVLSRGTLIASDPIRGEVEPLKEVTLPTYKMIGSFDSGSYEFVNGLSLSHGDLEKITSH